MCVYVCVFQVGIVSYGLTVKHLVNLSQFDNTLELQRYVSGLPQHTGMKTQTFLAIETARYIISLLRNNFVEENLVAEPTDIYSKLSHFLILSH